MSEKTYTRAVQALILFVVVTGTLYAEPAASAGLRIEPGRHGAFPESGETTCLC